MNKVGVFNNGLNVNNSINSSVITNGLNNLNSNFTFQPTSQEEDYKSIALAYRYRIQDFSDVIDDFCNTLSDKKINRDNAFKIVSIFNSENTELPLQLGINKSINAIEKELKEYDEAQKEINQERFEKDGQELTKLYKALYKENIKHLKVRNKRDEDIGEMYWTNWDYYVQKAKISSPIGFKIGDGDVYWQGYIPEETNLKTKQPTTLKTKQPTTLKTIFKFIDDGDIYWERATDPKTTTREYIISNLKPATTKQNIAYIDNPFHRTYVLQKDSAKPYNKSPKEEIKETDKKPTTLKTNQFFKDIKLTDADGNILGNYGEVFEKAEKLRKALTQQRDREKQSLSNLNKVRTKLMINELMYNSLYLSILTILTGGNLSNIKFNYSEDYNALRLAIYVEDEDGEKRLFALLRYDMSGKEVVQTPVSIKYPSNNPVDTSDNLTYSFKDGNKTKEEILNNSDLLYVKIKSGVIHGKNNRYLRNPNKFIQSLKKAYPSNSMLQNIELPKSHQAKLTHLVKTFNHNTNKTTLNLEKNNLNFLEFLAGAGAGAGAVGAALAFSYASKKKQNLRDLRQNIIDEIKDSQTIKENLINQLKRIINQENNNINNAKSNKKSSGGIYTKSNSTNHFSPLENLSQEESSPIYQRNSNNAQINPEIKMKDLENLISKANQEEATKIQKQLKRLTFEPNSINDVSKQIAKTIYEIQKRVPVSKKSKEFEMMIV
jgi:hypothetical protein